MKSIIIDTDAGHDDVMALLLALQSEILDVKAVTTVTGNAPIEAATRNAQFTLDLLECADADVPPLYSGASQPLQRDLVTAQVHGETGLDGVDVSDTQFELTDDAVDRIYNLISQQPGEISLLTLGPLTNAARLLQKYPDSEQLLKEIVVMGGAIYVPGNQNRVAEFNMSVDPDAARVVFESSLTKTLVPLDVCKRFRFSLEEFEKITNPVLKEPIISMMREFQKGIESHLKVKDILIYDAYAAYYLINPEAFETEDLDIVVEDSGSHTYGMTVVEKRNYKTPKPNTTVALSVDEQTFKRDFIATLSQ